MKRFVELTVRKGSTLASLERHNPEDLHVVLEAFLTYLPDDLISASTALTKAQEFLDGAGDWLRETPVSILLQSLKKGLIFEATVGYRKIAVTATHAPSLRTPCFLKKREGKRCET